MSTATFAATSRRFLESIRDALLQQGLCQEPDCVVPGRRVVCPVGEMGGLAEQACPPRGRLRNLCLRH